MNEVENGRVLNPSILKEDLELLGFNAVFVSPNNEDGGTWSYKFRKNLNILYHFDYLEIQWFCGTNRYTIWRQTKAIRNIPCFEGFLNDVEDLKWLLERFDYHKFYNHD